MPPGGSGEQWLSEVHTIAQGLAQEDAMTVSAIIAFLLAYTRHDFSRVAKSSLWPTSGLTAWVRELGEAQTLARKIVQDMQRQARGDGGRQT